MYVKVMEYNIICNSPIRWQLLTSIKSYLAFFANSHYFKDSKIRDIENVDQDNDVQHSQWRHSMANTWIPMW